MAGRDPRIAVHLSDAERAKLEWVAGRRGATAHAWAKRLLLEALARESDPPAGWWIGRGDDGE